ncbi:SIR2 family NAD-dependent protein deacylase [Paractinoplanes globisporus]|uniref:SIR2 family protein n=1 Tax=Paractinoplanes globisporus TaxID=113565 RepID=A0ABW6WH72_9ACTN|nr:SIR2 family protein [Actinoplanes globisporus]
MSEDAGAGYLSGLEPGRAKDLARVNRPGLEALRGYLAAGEAVAFLGAGASAPLYPLWTQMIGGLVDAAAHRLSEAEAATVRALAGQAPEEAVEILRRQLGAPEFREALRETFRVRRDPESGRTWTDVHELVCRCAFKAVVTTNYDPGIVDARNRVRPDAVGTGFMSWTDEDALDRWRTGDVFGDGELPVLFAHGRHTQPEAMVLASTEYRRAYTGKLARVLATMVDSGHLVWIGFSFADQRIAAILREVAQASGTRVDPGAAPRHIAILPWDPETADNDPGFLAQRAVIGYGAHVIFYPAPGNDHSALATLLADLVDPRYPSVPEPPAPKTKGTEMPVSWTPPAEPVPHFTGRIEELARLARWASDPAVRLIGVTAWGGAGKTALVTEWLDRRGGAAARAGIRGVFGWSFYADASAEHWAEALLDWASRELGMRVVGHGRLGAAVLTLLSAVPLVLVLDGLEVAQEGPDEGEFGRLLDGTLREVLTGACQIPHGGLVVLTSRFPFADVEGFDGLAARMLDVPPFTPTEGADLLAASGGGWLPEKERRELVAGVDGHALAVAALGKVLADHPPTADLAGLRAELAEAAGTNTRVSKVLSFYATRLAEADRYLVAAVALFARPVTPAAVLTVSGHEAFRGHLEGWTPGRVEAAARDRLAGLLSWHPDGTLAAHPLVRDTFRPLALGAAEIAADATLTGLPAGTITNREDGLRVVEAIDLLIAADQWQAADDLYGRRTGDGDVWLSLPAARLGQRAASAFVGTPQRRIECAIHLDHDRVVWYLNEVGLFAVNGGDLGTAREYLNAAAAHYRDTGNHAYLAIELRNLSECLGFLGDIDAALQAAEHAATAADRAGDRGEIMYGAAYRGWLLMLAGETLAAEEQFLAADRVQHADDYEGKHLYSFRGVRWAELLARTSRTGPARALTERNRAVCLRNGWNADLARCDQLLGALDLADGDAEQGLERVAAAAATFRDADYLVHLAETLPVLAECARADGDLDAAERHATEALNLAGPRGFAPAQAAALIVRARIHADRATAGDPAHLEPGRDAADTAHRLARRHRLAWYELDALDAHARLDSAAGINRGWAARATALRARLVPAGLDPDPPATVERQVAAEKAAEDAQEPD